MGKFIDLTGKRFKKLLVIEYNGKGKWICKCDCGKTKIIRGDSLKQGLTQSCGCLHKSIVIKTCKNNFLKHGLSNTRINNIWFHMLARCYNNNSKNYKHYGGKGISVCKEWRENFLNFYNWSMNNGYKDNLTIDRINVNGNYEPNNCRWISQKIQQNNRTNNHLITYKGVTRTLSEWSELRNIKLSTLAMRLNHYGWNIEKALET